VDFFVVSVWVGEICGVEKLGFAERVADFN
jgi:hypothetical protein